MGEELELDFSEKDRRVFLGWERPFLSLLVEWLWERREGLAEMLVVVPTAQSGRRLRESLAEAGGCLSPKVVTRGYFLQQETAAPDAVELLAWVEVLEGVSDWDSFAAAFPTPPGEGEAPGWAMGLARSLMSVRVSLRENALTMGVAARRLGETVEAERWKNLAELEDRVEALLRKWGLSSANAEIARGRWSAPGSFRKVVVAGVADLPEAVVRLLERSSCEVQVIVGAEANEAVGFDFWGRPSEEWLGRRLVWPERGSVTPTVDPREQAESALRLVAEAGTSSNELALGSADEEAAGELVRVFERAGWSAFDPGRRRQPVLSGWLSAWRNYLRHPGVAEGLDVVGFAQSGVLVRGKRAQRVRALSRARDEFLVRSREDLVRAQALVDQERNAADAEGNESGVTRSEKMLEDLALAMETLELLESRRGVFLREGFHQSMSQLQTVLDPEGESGVWDWLAATEVVAEKSGREATFWIDLLLASPKPEPLAVPDGRVLDVQGWVELLYESGSHLVVCGMNEGKVPVAESADPWLPDGARKVLGLQTVDDRAARDAYLLAAMMKAREEQGRVDLLLAKSSLSGDSLTPSRLLLAAEGEELARRVQLLFAEMETPEAGLAWTVDDHWKWRPPVKKARTKLSVTAFSDYLACPFRFYLKHVVRMSDSDPERVEWNARDFGNVAHLVLERWALDETARDFSKSEAIEEWVHAELDRQVSERFGSSPPLAVRIQRESLRQRLTWFAHRQACERAAGWRIVEVEKRFSLDLDGMEVRGQVDRIEEHSDGRRRILDYKTTGEAKDVEKAHRKRVSASTKWPEHLKEVEAVRTSDGKSRWMNLQVAFYSAALGDVDEIGYFALGATEADVKISLWEGFGKAEEESALACAKWVAEQVQEGVFWPPAERVDFDDYKVLAVGRSLEDLVQKEVMS